MTAWTGPLQVKKSDGSLVTFVNADGDLVAGAAIIVDDGDTFDDTNGNEILEFTVIASAVNHLGIVNAATGNSPILRAEGEVNTGIIFDNSEGEEILILDSVATSVNEITIRSAATGNKPILAATGEADTGIEFHNDQAEEILILASAATSVNEFTITSAAAAANPTLAATGTDTDISVELTPKGTGNVVATTGGFEGANEVLTAASPTLTVYGSSSIDSTSNAVDGTLGSGTFIGQVKRIVMTNSSNSSTISITNHQTSDPEIATFDAVDEYGVFEWSGTEWVTIFATCTFV